MTGHSLLIWALAVADLYFLWTVLRAPSAGEISTKWGTLHKSEHPGRFWTTFWFQLALAAVVFPVIILRLASGQPTD